MHAGALIVVALLLGLLARAVTQASDATKAQLNLIWLTDGVGDGRLWDALMSTPQYLFGSAESAVGWLDILPGPITVIASNAAFWGAILLGRGVMFWRKAFAVGFVFAVLVFVPAVLVSGVNAPRSGSPPAVTTAGRESDSGRGVHPVVADPPPPADPVIALANELERGAAVG